MIMVERAGNFKAQVPLARRVPSLTTFLCISLKYAYCGLTIIYFIVVYLVVNHQYKE